MNEQERQELIERRKKELSEKELESDLHRDLSLQEQKNKQREIRYKYESEYVEIAIIFFLAPSFPCIFFYLERNLYSWLFLVLCLG